jgi:ABC-2 type transport system permease protein
MSSEVASPVASPIADLTYRNYDGPLRTRAARWWIVALATLRLVSKKPGYWITIVICVLPYLGHGLQFYLQNRAGLGNNPMFSPPDPKQKWALVVFQSLNGDINCLGLFLIALIAGSGSISADNRANALLVYLSKPITKGDYLLGKWAGVFLAIFGVAFVPGLLLYTSLAFSYARDGFFKDDPWLLLHLTLAAAVQGVIHTSLILGFSAWSKSPSTAGAIYAAVYFVGNIIVGGIMGHLLMRDDYATGNLVQHFAIGGVIDGLAQNLLHVSVVDLFRRSVKGVQPSDTAPALWPLIGLATAMVAISIAAARAKIQAVEVIRG